VTIRALSSFEAAALGIETESNRSSKAISSGVRGVAITGEQNAPALEVTEIFPYQSYFDDVLLERALLPQAPNEGIVDAIFTQFKKIDLSGYAVGLHPSSETPVAIRFKTGAQQGASPIFRLKPGEVLRPHGRPQGAGASGQFSGVEWGIPQGWLGGGAANLVLFRTADASVHWNDWAEVAFYRTRMPIYAPDDVPAAPLAAKNWPGRFPWAFAAAGADNLNQRGRAALSLHPTRTLMRLRATSLDDPADMRVMFFGADVLAQGLTGATDLADVGFIDTTWGSFSAVGAGLAVAAQPLQMLTGELERLSCNLGGIVLMDLSGGDLAGKFVDFVRYGRL
jgi:hypothetical protein